MSASLLNFATQPGAQPGASQGIAAQAAQAQQAQGPMAGFEALLAALFGDQGVGVVDPNAAATAAATGGKTAGKGLLGGKVVSDGLPGQAKADDTQGADDATAATTTMTTTTVPDAVLALLVPAPTTATTVQTPTPAGEASAAPGAQTQAAAGSATDKAAAAAADAFAKLAAASATDPGVAKAATAVAQAGTPAVQAQAQAPAASPTAQPQDANGQAAPTATAAALDPVTPALVAQAAQAAPAAQAKTAEQVAAPAAKDKPAAPKSARVEGVRTQADPTALTIAPKAGDTDAALAAAAAGKDASGDEPSLPTPERVAKPQATDGQPLPTDFSTASTTTPATLLHAAAVAVRGAPQTVANLAAQIAKKLDARSSRFDVQLDPAGLGKVDVRMEIAASGKMSAALTFDTPQAAAELKARAGELQKALEQAGFDLTGGMSFDVATDRGQGGRAQDQGADGGAQFRGRAFQAALDTSSDVAAATQLTFRRGSPAGVDVRI